MASLAQGTFKLDNTTLEVVSMSVEAPQPEIVDMTGGGDSVKSKVMVRTGAYISPGRVSIDGFGFADPMTLAGFSGQAVFTTSNTPAVTITRWVIVDSVSVDAKIGDVYRYRITMTPTDFTQDQGSM